ncbi:MAG: DUF4145 domain-containing protein [Celeribacter sp.]|jgi:hypothetical protein
MNIEIISVKNPVWSNSENTQINCTIRTSAYADEHLFTVSPHDPEIHGREIFNRCVSGEFGEIRPYTAPLHEECNDGSPVFPRWTSAWPEVHDFLVEANIENGRASPRAIGLVWGSMIEATLNRFIDHQLRLKNRALDSLRYGNGKKCGDNFESRISGAVSEGMLEVDMSNHLHAIRRIRNACAHEWRLNYENPKVKELDNDFAILRSAYDPKFLLEDLESLMRIVFSQACCRIIICLTERTVSEMEAKSIS